MSISHAFPVLLNSTDALMSLFFPFSCSFSRLGLSDREEWIQLDGRRVKTIIPGQAAEEAPPPVVGPDVSALTVEETRRENIPVMPKPPIKVRLASFFFFRSTTPNVLIILFF